MSVLVWRIGVDAPAYTADALSGEGGRQTGGRWNRIGTPMVYASNSIALACLETVVHLGAALPFNRYLVRLEVPDDTWSSAIRLDPDAHVGWDALPEGKVSVDAGEAWATRRHSALLIVPSVIVPEENNVLINPAHADTARIQARKMRRWTYDTRLHSRS